MASIKDIAKACGVSVATVSKALNGHNDISQATKETEFEILEGSEEPIGGWISYGYAWKKPIPQLAVKTKGPVPVRFLTIIRPEGGKTEGHVTETEVQLSLENGKTLTLGTDKITW